MKSGAAYKVTVRVRNDGPVAWKAGWKLEPSGSEAAAVVQTDLEPGRIADITFAVLAQKNGVLQWGVSDGEKSLPAKSVIKMIVKMSTALFIDTCTSYLPLVSS
jgi:hypothetical protein